MLIGTVPSVTWGDILRETNFAANVGLPKTLTFATCGQRNPEFDIVQIPGD